MSDNNKDNDATAASCPICVDQNPGRVFNISDIPSDVKVLRPWPHVLIKQRSTVVQCIDEGTLQTIYRMMATCLKFDGIGLAASQIGLYKKLFVIRDFDDDNQPLDTFHAYFNLSFVPVKNSGVVDGIEGCLSIPNAIYKVHRHKEVNATWQEIAKDKLELVSVYGTVTGHKARVFGHEYDHTLGVCIADIGRKYHKK
jgi:peptide deformylase